ncbi:Uncharacterised protein [Chlamydia trachomatis]|nr:Uncharacterised protein [Chlamydia trachomatis]
MRISEPSFTDCGIDAAGNWIDQTRTRVDGRSAPSTLSLPMSQGREIRGLSARGLSATPAQGGAEPRTRTQGVVWRGEAHPCTRRRVPCQAPHPCGVRRPRAPPRTVGESPSGTLGAGCKTQVLLTCY